MKNDNKKRNKGITLIALVITIIVLLILAGVTIATLTGDNGILTKANKAKETTEIEEEKEIIKVSIMQIKAGNENGELKEEELNNALNQNSSLDNKATLKYVNENKFIIQFSKSKRYYQVNGDGKIEYMEGKIEFKTLKIKCVNKDIENNIIKEFWDKEISYRVLKGKYSITPPQIDEYEAEEDILEGEITEDKEITVEYFKKISTDDLIFTPYNENGIESYMLGDGSNVFGNSIKEKKIKSVLYIPEKYNGINIKKIEKYAFRSAENIYKLYIPDNIESIENAAFADCTNLKYINLNSKKTGVNIFYYAKNLKKVDIGENVEYLGSGTFWNCSNLTDVTIYSEKINFYDNASTFSSTNLEKIKVNEENNAFCTIDGVLYSKDKSILYLLPVKNKGNNGEFVIPNTVRRIKRSAIRSNQELTKITVPSTVDVVEDAAFAECSRLEYVNIDANTLAINTFYNSQSLKRCDIGENTTNIGPGCFIYCHSLESINYNGTKSNWNNIYKGNDWSLGIKASEVKCSDGNINI